MQNLRKTNENGRSMVEMLGVLAIIGVLSVAGVAGYKAAVRKSLANNLLNQASMRATDVATKIGSGNLDALDSDSFAGNLGGGVTMSSAVKGADGYTDYDESDEQFTLTMEGVDEELCQQMQSMAGGSRSVVRAVLCDGDNAILTFNKDLSANPVSSDFDGNKEGCESSGRKYCDNDTCIPAAEECPTGGSGEGGGETGTLDPCADVECGEGLSCSRGQCKCPDGNLMCGTQCCEKGSYCIESESGRQIAVCSSPESGCKSNEDCEKTEYCKVTAYNCNSLWKGTCKPKGVLETDFTIKELNLPKWNLTVYKNSEEIEWYSAINLCQAHGLKLVTMTDVGIQDSEGNTHCYFDSSRSDYSTAPCICSGDDTDCSQTKTELNKIATSGYVWFAETAKSRVCSARYIHTSLGGIGGQDRNYYGYAFCTE